jgi:hypothetical protein
MLPSDMESTKKNYKYVLPISCFLLPLHYHQKIPVIKTYIIYYNGYHLPSRFRTGICVINNF